MLTTLQGIFWGLLQKHKLLQPWAILIVLSSLTLVGNRPIHAIEFEPKTLEQTVQEASGIFVGTLTKQQSRYDESNRFIFTDYIFTVEDSVLVERGIRKGKEVRLTFRGGTIGNTTEEIVGMPKLGLGERYILMLRSNWEEIKGFPLVGSEQGLLRVVFDLKTNSHRVLQANGVPLVLNNRSLVQLSESASAADIQKGVTLEAFVTILRRELPRIKQAPAPQQLRANPEDPRAMKTYARPADPQARRRTSQPVSKPVDVSQPLEEPKVPKNAYRQRVGSGEAITLQGLSEDSSVIQPSFATSGAAANLPIVVSQLPSGAAPWSPEDQHSMDNWNHYASVFEVLAQPSSTWAYGNGVFDIAGWPDSATMKRQFGSTWEELGFIGVCFRKIVDNRIVEADIALNPAHSWTLDDEAVHNGSTLLSFRRTMTHELGHMWGLDHEFNFLSVMNYPPGVYRPFPLPFMDDAEAIRQTYPTQKVATTDLGIYLFYSAGFQDWRQATFPSTVSRGSPFTVMDYHLENVGTEAVATPTVEWYLTTQRNFTGAYFYLGVTTYPQLNTFSYFTPTTVARSLTIPTNVPTGSYYLTAFIRGDQSETTNGFQVNNSRSFSRTTIFVP